MLKNPQKQQKSLPKRKKTGYARYKRGDLVITREELKTRKRKRLKKTVKIILALFLLGIFGLVVSAISVFAYFAKDLPDPQKLAERQMTESTKIYDRTGEHLLYEIHGEEKRTIVPFAQISNYLIKATLTAEDDDFYNHRGIDFRSILRAAWSDVKGGGVRQGGSTITQQFIKNSILTPERTFSRKFKELILSLELERRFSKDQILEMYLNEIPYGSNAYGIEAASQTFFNKKASELTLGEAATLASLPRATTYYSPFGSHPEALAARREYILNRMATLGYITPEEANSAKQEELSYAENREGIIAPHFVLYIKEILADKYGEDFIERGGLKVYTTLDYDKQKIAEELVYEMSGDYPQKFNARNAALLASDPKTGQILVMVGSRDYFDLQNDGNVNVTLRPRQPGSSFKPFAYARAFQKGYTPDTLLFDLTTNFGLQGGKEYIPQNYDGKEHGSVTMRTALANSLNIPAVKTLYLAGIDETIDLANQMGITTLGERSRFGLSLVLGGGEVKLIDFVPAYGVFANDGIRQEKTVIMKIEDKDGQILEEWQQGEGKRVIPEQVAREINSILSDNNARAMIFGTHNYLNLGGIPVAAKTGTTQDYRDAWTVGYTPSLAAGVWVGNNDNSEMRRADGSQVAAPIWQAFMKKALEGASTEKFTPYTKYQLDKMILHGKYNETTARVCEVNNQILHETCCRPEQVVEKTFREIHTILYYADKDNPRGPVPEHPENDPMYERWEKPIQEWIAREKIETGKVPTETCDYHEEKNQPAINITSPADNDLIEDSNINIEADGEAPLTFDKVEFYLDNKLFDVKNGNPPFKTHYVSYDEPGFHTIKVIAYDKMGNTAQDSVTINLKNEQIIYISQPAGQLTLQDENFPYKLKAVASHPNGIRKINFYARDLTRDKRAFLIGSSFEPATPDGEEYDLIWERKPLPGQYEIYTILVSHENETTQSARVVVEIK
ncbi:MAG: PBP1A family penicillin-binding protein [Patescibacteria group bacterium]|nr:PBP1A family penicillin-binding protein [Patescibacteria group bacterium]